MAQFGEILAELRQDHDMTQKALADALFVTVATISNYEHGVHFPDVEKLVMIANIFNVTTDYLLGRCRTNISPDFLNQELLSGRSAGKVIEEIKRLTPDRKKAISLILDDMNISMLIGELNK